MFNCRERLVRAIRQFATLKLSQTQALDHREDMASSVLVKRVNATEPCRRCKVHILALGQFALLQPLPRFKFYRIKILCNYSHLISRNWRQLSHQPHLLLHYPISLPPCMTPQIWITQPYLLEICRLWWQKKSCKGTFHLLCQLIIACIQHLCTIWRACVHKDPRRARVWFCTICA